MKSAPRGSQSPGIQWLLLALSLARGTQGQDSMLHLLAAALITTVSIALSVTVYVHDRDLRDAVRSPTRR
jgi:hypothetical protein